jgi:hypothetical protein
MKSRLVVAILAITSIVACGSDSTGPQLPTGTHSLALTPNNASADGVVRGVVRGMKLTNPLDSTSYELLAGAKIDVYLEFTQIRTDSSTPPLHKLMGTLTTDAKGAFELTNVPTGYFQLLVTPPAGSPYQPGTSGTVAFSAGSTSLAVVWLWLK